MISERIYELIVQLYPRRYRQQFGEEMKYVFSESLKDAYSEEGEYGIIHLWTRTVIDSVKSLATQHYDSMKTKSTQSTIQNSLIRVAFGTAALLMIPLIGMQVSLGGWNWTLFDFIVAGVLISGTGFVLELVWHKVRTKTRRLMLIGGVLLAFMYLWAELAVGIFTNWGS